MLIAMLYTAFIRLGIYMDDYEDRQVGNTRERTPNMVSRLKADWDEQGIRYELTDPVPTDTFSAEQLKAMGMVGVTLIIPKPEVTE